MGLILSGVALNSAYAAQDGEEGSSDIEITDSQEDDTNTDEEKQSRAVNLSEEDLIEPYVNTGGSAARASAVALGDSSSAYGAEAVAIGYYATARASSSNEMGVYTTASGMAANALGYRAMATKEYANVIGTNAQAAGRYAIGSMAVAGTAKSVEATYMLGGQQYTVAGTSQDSKVSVVSFGATTDEGKIVRQQYVGAGSIEAESTDAVNGSQLYGTNQRLDGKR